MTQRDQNILQKLERELNLKQLQIKSLLAITQAINDNVPAAGLFNMYKTFMSWEMGVDRMALFVKDTDTWRCAIHQNVSEEVRQEKTAETLIQFTRLYTVKEDSPKVLHEFDIVIPVYHKKTPIAYSLVGGVKEREDIYNKIQFITTITNIIAVAIENKRLFKRQVDQETYKREMALASQVQQMLIPDSLPQGYWYELDAIYQPHYNVGGDYFDIINYDEDRFAFCIADISGKGVGAALLMANFQANLQNLIYQYRDLQTFVIALNDAVFRITKSDKYLTLFVGELNARTKTLNYINAGHIPPFLVSNGTTLRLDKGCTVIGAFGDLPFIESGQVKLSDKGMILTFTDGLTDLRNSTGAYFDDVQIQSILNNFKGDSAKAFNETLLEAMNEFRGAEDFPDDIAVLTCRYDI